MPNKFLIGFGTPIVFADSLSYVGDGGAKTHDLDLGNLAAGSAWQSDKADLDTGGVSNRFAYNFAITIRMVEKEFAVITVGEGIDFYWAPSVSSVAANANPGGVVGSNGSYSGTAGSTLAESLRQLQFLGPLIVTNDEDPVVLQTTFQATFGTQYGTLIIHNNQTSAIIDAAAEGSVTFTPREMEIQ